MLKRLQVEIDGNRCAVRASTRRAYANVECRLTEQDALAGTRVAFENYHWVERNSQPARHRLLYLNAAIEHPPPQRRSSCQTWVIVGFKFGEPGAVPAVLLRAL